LEKETGVRLLEPAGRRVRLTAQADVLVEHAQRLLAEVQRAETALARSLQDTVGTLRVAAFQTAVLTLVPPTMLRLADQHPALRVEVTEAEPEVALQALVSGQFDLVLGEKYPGHPLPRPRESERLDLFPGELRLATPTSWRESSLPALAARPFVVEPDGTTAHEWSLSTCRAAGSSRTSGTYRPTCRSTSRSLRTGSRLRSSLTCPAPRPAPVSRPATCPATRRARSPLPCASAPSVTPRSARSSPR
jgi:DNA-binding transcriptional LysR family regulator